MSQAYHYEFLPSVITYHGGAQTGTWESMLSEVEQFGLKKVALFLTGLNLVERRKCYKALDALRPRVQVPFVHARSDMQPYEYYRLIDRFGTEIFNLHQNTERYPHVGLPSDLRMRIGIENAEPISRSALRHFGGLCIDLSHLEDARLRADPEYATVCQLVDQFPVLANHISAITRIAQRSLSISEPHFDDHWLSKRTEIDYVKNYPPKFFGRYCALELTNPIADQLALIRRLTMLLNRAEPSLAVLHGLHTNSYPRERADSAAEFFPR